MVLSCWRYVFSSWIGWGTGCREAGRGKRLAASSAATEPRHSARPWETHCVGRDRAGVDLALRLRSRLRGISTSTNSGPVGVHTVVGVRPRVAAGPAAGRAGPIQTDTEGGAAAVGGTNEDTARTSAAAATRRRRRLSTCQERAAKVAGPAM